MWIFPQSPLLKLFFHRHWELYPGSLHRAISSAHFSFWDRVSLYCPDWAQTYDLPASVSPECWNYRHAQLLKHMLTWAKLRVRAAFPERSRFLERGAYKSPSASSEHKPRWALLSALDLIEGERIRHDTGNATVNQLGRDQLLRMQGSWQLQEDRGAEQGRGMLEQDGLGCRARSSSFGWPVLCTSMLSPQDLQKDGWDLAPNRSFVPRVPGGIWMSFPPFSLVSPAVIVHVVDLASPLVSA